MRVAGYKEPILRWAGGKRWFLPWFSSLIEGLDFRNYHEPFLGGGVVGFNLRVPGTKYLSDSNPDLINFYVQLRDNPDGVIRGLYGLKNDSATYYRIRASRPRSLTKKASFFYYLNRTSFNGIYRVNRNGDFNVPFGNKTRCNLFEYERMRALSRETKKVKFASMDFRKMLRLVRPRDLVFLDPPYTVAHEHNGFVKYNQKLFSFEDQVALANEAKRLNQLGAYIVITNAKHDSIQRLYADCFQEVVLKRTSTISGNSTARKQVHEYVFTNIE